MAKKKENDSKYESLNIDGTQYRTHLSPKYLQRKTWKAKNPNHVLNPIPGTILKILVKEGQKVTIGKCLYVLEAMKMKNRFNAEKNGIITKIIGKEGAIVPKNTLLIEMEDLPPKKIVRVLSSRSKTK